MQGWHASLCLLSELGGGRQRHYLPSHIPIPYSPSQTVVTNKEVKVTKIETEKLTKSLISRNHQLPSNISLQCTYLILTTRLLSIQILTGGSTLENSLSVPRNDYLEEVHPTTKVNENLGEN